MKMKMKNLFLYLVPLFISQVCQAYNFTIKNCTGLSLSVNLHGKTDFCKSQWFYNIPPGGTQEHSLAPGCCAGSVHLYKGIGPGQGQDLGAYNIFSGMSSEYKLCSSTTIYIGYWDNKWQANIEVDKGDYDFPSNICN